MNTFDAVTFISPKSGESYRMHQATDVPPSAQNLKTIVEICNQDDVHKLFGSMKGRAYEESDAKGFLSWAADGWRDMDHFVFFVSSSQGDVAAALDIKSNALAASEIGYWCDQRHRGLMSTAVGIMVDWAKTNSFESLYATPTNEKSAAVLKRVGYVRADFPDHAFGRWSLRL